MRNIFVQTVEDHILADAIIALCNHLGTTLLLRLPPSVKDVVVAADTIAQKRRAYTVHSDNGTPLMGKDLSAAIRKCLDENGPIGENMLFR